MIFDTFRKLGHHITILGIELVFDSTMKIINTGSKTKKLLTQSIYSNMKIILKNK
ncbi:hypothetical protein [Terrisporobacter glycolicus]|uniref:hypothetical protein n=1 Tax=Terrisporobacter petrolearius TaxID=1460447 RepID=UPI0015876534